MVVGLSLRVSEQPAKRLESENVVGIRVTPHHLLSETTMFVSRQDSEVIATVTLIGDSADGIPVECIFSYEVAAVRAC
ncbi:hypothetical protein Mal4_02870 [Maioricimonas rarisocia]|uniref:N-acyl amino acid synthase FeeM catalytic core domain-containing protein n=1 Tax=Maioricimonas rarisocia TaxID=2528026 RepID=A0A517Z0J7_9PLAN|nr:hypothetical protein [Maioricimonas rarisocia]QDU36004.1 hypothetical protein Mal4_02870 [Maioricimonas rarisocia]